MAAGDVLCEIEAGKAVVQVTSPGDGVLRAICRTEGDLLLSGTLLAVVADESDPAYSEILVAPEPATVLLVGGALLALVRRRRRRR